MKKITVSDQVREMHDMGTETKEIAKLLGIRYQFAYNVVTQHVAAAALEALQKDKAVTPQPQPIMVKQPDAIIARQPEPIKVVPQPEPVKAIETPALIMTDAAVPFKMAPTADVPLRMRQQQQKAGVLQRLFGSK